MCRLLMIAVVMAYAQVATSIPYGIRVDGVIDCSFNVYLSDPQPNDPNLGKPGTQWIYKDGGNRWVLKIFPKVFNGPVQTNAVYASAPNAAWNYANGGSLTVTKVSGGSEWPTTLVVKDKR